MNLVGAELSELSRGTCTIAVERRPELLQQHGFFHGGVTAFLVDNATTIAAATSRGQPALTAEYKLNLLSPRGRREADLPGKSDQAGPSGCRGRGRRVLRQRWHREAYGNCARLDRDVERGRRRQNEKPGRLKRPG